MLNLTKIISNGRLCYSQAQAFAEHIPYAQQGAFRWNIRNIADVVRVLKEFSVQ